ncbi:MAG: hypothetical protein AB7L84_01020 [Acidimicrobiia bacterium]
MADSWGTQGWVAPGTEAVDAPPPAGGPAPGSPSTPPAPARPVEPRSGLRPSTMSDVLDGAFATLKHAPVLLIGLAAVLIVPLSLITAWATADVVEQGLSIDLWTTESDAEVTSSGGEWVGVLSLLGPSLAGTLVAVGAMRVAWARLTDQPVDAAAVRRETLRRSPTLLVAWIVGHLLEAVGVIGLFVGSLFIAALLFVTAPALVAEDLGPFAALRRSMQLTGRRYGATLGFCTLLVIVLWLFDEALSAIPSLLSLVPGLDGLLWVFVAATGIVSGVLLAPVTAAAATLWYFDLRVRTEGLDVAVEVDRAFPSAAP